MSTIVPEGTPTQVPNYSARRREHAVRMLRGMRPELRSLSASARQLYAVGLLLCDDDGRLSEDTLAHHVDDPSVQQAAANLLRKAKVA